MKVYSYIKALNKARKQYPEIDKTILNYENGLITFQECLTMISAYYSQLSALDAIRNITAEDITR
jgi:hypothetical protein